MHGVSKEQLVNYGFVKIHDEPPGETATIIVVGLPRSGTSMVAATLLQLGVHIGAVKDSVVFEDVAIAEAIEVGNSDKLSCLILERNQKHKIWGFKRPEAYKQLDLICRLCRNPRVVITFRDLLAIALRNNISMQIDATNSLPGLVDKYRSLVSAIERLKVPTLLLSYEKALQYPYEFVSELGLFCGVKASAGDLTKACATIENGNPRYLQLARLQYDGSLGAFVDGQLRGWVKAKHHDNLRVTVELLIDSSVVTETRADLFRPDVLKAGFGDGRYGFAFSLGGNLSKDSIINVRVKNSGILLANSGKALSQYSA
jgi:hypothetical protein